MPLFLRLKCSPLAVGSIGSIGWVTFTTDIRAEGISAEAGRIATGTEGMGAEAVAGGGIIWVGTMVANMFGFNAVDKLPEGRSEPRDRFDVAFTRSD